MKHTPLRKSGGTASAQSTKPATKDQKRKKEEEEEEEDL